MSLLMAGNLIEEWMTTRSYHQYTHTTTIPAAACRNGSCVLFRLCQMRSIVEERSKEERSLLLPFLSLAVKSRIYLLQRLPACSRSLPLLSSRHAEIQSTQVLIIIITTTTTAIVQEEGNMKADLTRNLNVWWEMKKTNMTSFFWLVYTLLCSSNVKSLSTDPRRSQQQQ